MKKLTQEINALSLAGKISKERSSRIKLNLLISLEKTTPEMHAAQGHLLVVLGGRGAAREDTSSKDTALPCQYTTYMSIFIQVQKILSSENADFVRNGKKTLLCEVSTSENYI